MFSLCNRSEPWKIKQLFLKLSWPDKVDTHLKGQTNHLFLLPWLLIAGRGHQTWSNFSKYFFQLSRNSNETMGGFVSDGGINFYFCALDVKQKCLRKLFLG